MSEIYSNYTDASVRINHLRRLTGAMVVLSSTGGAVLLCVGSALDKPWLTAAGLAMVTESAGSFFFYDQFVKQSTDNAPFVELEAMAAESLE